MPLIIALSPALALSHFLSLSPSFHTSSSFFSFIFEVIIGSYDGFMTFILLGSSLPLSFPSLSFPSPSLSLSVNYPCSLICRHPSNLRFPVMNQVPPPPPLPPPPFPLPISAKQLTNRLTLIKHHRKTHAKLHLFSFVWPTALLVGIFCSLLCVPDQCAVTDRDVLSRQGVCDHHLHKK